MRYFTDDCTSHLSSTAICFLSAQMRLFLDPVYGKNQLLPILRKSSKKYSDAIYWRHWLGNYNGCSNYFLLTEINTSISLFEDFYLWWKDDHVGKELFRAEFVPSDAAMFIICLKRAGKVRRDGIRTLFWRTIWTLFWIWRARSNNAYYLTDPSSEIVVVGISRRTRAHIFQLVAILLQERVSMY